jgi:hypothetical protein
MMQQHLLKMFFNKKYISIALFPKELLKICYNMYYVRYI